ncbi:MAG: hypothetical protein ACK5PP_15740 [Acidimicrobiales bacterium]
MTHYRGPELLTASHDVTGFDCGDQVLNDWLRQRAARNQPAPLPAMLLGRLAVEAAGFSQHYGFEPSPMDDLTLMLLTKHIRT